MYVSNDIISNIYETYREENCDSGDKSLKQQDFLKLFKMKNVSNTTVWKWMQHVWDFHTTREKVTLVISMKVRRMYFRKRSSSKIILNMTTYSPMGPN